MRTIKEIYDEIISEKETLSSLSGLLPTGTRYDNLLSDLTTGSKVAIWRLWAYVVAVAIFTHEALFEAFAAEVEATAQQAIWGTDEWYYLNTLKFQFGYTLVWDGTKYAYSTLDPSAQLVSYCAVEERPDGLLVIKTAKKNTLGAPVPLTAPELTALEAYCEQTKFAGTRLSVVSFPADSVKLAYRIYYDPILPQSVVSTRVENAVSLFLSQLPFNGRFRLNSLTDVLQKIDGVVDPVFEYAEARYGALPYAPFDSEYNSNSGYMEVDPSFPLSSTFTYLPYE